MKKPASRPGLIGPCPLLSTLGVLLCLLPASLSAIDSTTVINEVMYHPAGSATEWIELHNEMSVDMDLSGWTLSGGISYRIPEDTVISAGGHLLLAAEPAKLPGSIGPWQGRLNNSGDTIRLRNLSGRLMDELSYGDSGRWPVAADGSGASLARRASHNARDQRDGWTASWQAGGTPGGANFPPGPLLGPPVVLLPARSAWTFNDAGEDPGSDWAGKTWSAGAGAWREAPAPFLHPQNAPGATALADPEAAPNPTFYFQRSFEFQGDPAATTLSLALLADDGAVIHLNGREILRHNMPAGEMGPRTRASAPVGTPEWTVHRPALAGALRNGTNLLSVSVHQAAAGAQPGSGLLRVEEGGSMDAASNLALASRGAVAFAKDLLPGYAPTHTIANLNNGTYGNPSSWIGNSQNSFCGIRLGASPVAVGGIAFGRDNTNTYTDRTLGTYTVQYTTDPNPSASTPEDRWTTIGTLNYTGPGIPHFSFPSRRHRYEFTPVMATGVRLICPGNGIASGACIDELELYPPPRPDAAFDLTLEAREVLPSPADHALVINEISGADDPFFRVELKNEGSTAVDLAGLTLSGAPLPAGTLAPGAWLVLTESDLGFRPAAGSRLFLLAAGGRSVLDAARVRPEPRARKDGRMLVPEAATFGAENAFRLSQDLVVSEIMYHFPPHPSRDEVPAVTRATVVLPLDATWRYNRSAVDLGPDWASVSHPAGGDWLSGPALLGFETTPDVLPEPLRTPFASSGAPTYYFETEFQVTEAQLSGSPGLQLEHVIDDGAVFYINGREVFRFNMPAGPVSYPTLATPGVGNATLSAPVLLDPAAVRLVPGANRLSVEVHQQPPTSNDMICGARLSLVETITPAIPPRPVQSNPEEWIELHNKGTAAADLTGWKLDGGIRYAFPAGTVIPAGERLVVAGDRAALTEKWPEHSARIIGNFSGRLGNGGDRIQLEDALGNPADDVSYHSGGADDGGGSSLELRDPRANNSLPGAWEASDPPPAPWQQVRYRMVAGQRFGPAHWNEFRLGMLDAGECLLDDLRVVRDPDGAAQNLIQNGDFEGEPAGTRWRMLGNHRGSQVVAEPGNPANRVLHIIASGPTETNHNHIESTFLGNAALLDGVAYEVSFRARWVRGSNQLNTRAYYQKLARSHELPIPARLGTPGAPNSRAVANAGPLLHQLSHWPAVPAPGQPVMVTVAAEDPDGVARVDLHYRVDGSSSFQQVPMTATGDSWSAELPGQPAGRIVQFYVTAADGPGALGQAPDRGPAARALIQWDDNQGAALPARQLRLIMLQADRDFLLNTFNRLSNERLPGTLVEGGRDIFYDVGVHLKGTAAGRARDGESYVGYDIKFPPGRRYRGVHDSIGIDRSGRTPAVRQQDEIYVRHTFNRAGIPCPFDDLCWFIAPQPVHTGTAILQMAAYGSGWVDSQYRTPGTVFNFDVTYDPTSTSVPSDPESLKPPVPFVHVATDFANLGDDKEQYRGPFDIRAGKRRDDYRGLIQLAKTMALPAPEQARRAAELLDVDQVLRTTALVNLWGIGDTYYTGGFPHNIRLFIPEEGRPVHFLPWDMDFVMTSPVNAPLMPGTANALGRLISSTPALQRLYLGHVRHLSRTVFRSAYLNRWLSHYGAVVGQNFAAAGSYADARGSFAQSQFPPQAPFAITTNGGADLQTNARQITLEGTGWIDLKTVRRAGRPEPLELEWTDLTRWRVTLPLSSGINRITLEAVDFDGGVISSRSLTVHNSLVEPEPREFLRITELHYHPAGPTTPAELEVTASDSDFEFIELLNLGTEALNLEGVHFSEGISFTFPAGFSLAAGARTVVVRNRRAFEVRYGPGLPVAGEHAPTSLSNSGERLTLRDATGAVIQSFDYQDRWFPATDGGGYSLVVLAENDGAADLGVPRSWGIGFDLHGTPGRPNGGLFRHEFAGWQAQQFSPAELADPAFSGPMADPSGSGLSHLVRYVLGLGSADPANPPLAVTLRPDGSLRMSCRVRRHRLDGVLVLESSPDLRTWTPVTPAPAVQPLDDALEELSWILPAPSGPQFMRLRVRK